MLGVLLPDLHGEFFSELIRGIDQASQTGGYDLLLSSSHDHARELEAALHSMHGRVDGLVVMAPKVEAQVLQDLLPTNVPIVLLNSPDGKRAHGSLRIDSFGGARAIVGHLVEHGHRRIGIINGPAQNIDAEERLRGYRSALAEADLPVDGALEVPGDFTGSAGYRGAESLLGLDARPTAIFAANDGMAIGALSALRAAGVAVPDEMALVGFDDVSSTRYMIPPLTTVQGMISELGARAVRRLTEAVGGGPQPAGDQEVLPVSIVLRRSCGCSEAQGFRAGEALRQETGPLTS